LQELASGNLRLVNLDIFDVKEAADLFKVVVNSAVLLRVEWMEFLNTERVNVVLARVDDWNTFVNWLVLLEVVRQLLHSRTEQTPFEAQKQLI
jgi:hypothetical protein